MSDAPPIVVPVIIPPASGNPAPPLNGLDRSQLMEVFGTEIERARKEERDKLYTTLEEQQTQARAMAAELETLKGEREERLAREQEAQRAAEEEAERQRQEGLTMQQQFAEYRAQMDTELQEMQRARAYDQELLAKERRFGELNSFKTQLLTQNRDEIDPRFDKHIFGETEDAIAAAIEQAKRDTAEIGSEFEEWKAQNGLTQRRLAPPVPVSGIPPVATDALDASVQHVELTAQDLAEMDMATFAANRSQILRAASDHVHQHGLYGNR